MTGGFIRMTTAFPLLSSPDPAIRCQILDQLRGSRNAVNVPVAVLLRLLREDESTSVRWRALDALRAGRMTARALPTLVRALLRDESRSIRWRAAEALREVGKEAAPAVVDLLEAAVEDDPWVRWHARRALEDILAATRDCREVIGVLGSRRPSSVRARAATLLGSFVNASPDALTALHVCLTDGEAQIRSAAAVSIGRLRDPSPVIVSSIELLLSDPDPGVRTAALKALTNFHLPSRNTTQHLLQLVRHDVSQNRERASAALRLISPDADFTKANLAVALSDGEEAVRRSGAISLAHLGMDSPAVLSTLALALYRNPADMASWWALLNPNLAFGRRCRQTLTNLPPSVFMRALSEAIAQGTLPTIGLRTWPPGFRIRFPSREGGDTNEPAEYPWKEHGVFHSWESLDAAGVSATAIRQACVHTDWFPDVHLIAIAQFLLNWIHLRQLALQPIMIEGQAVGFILQGGGNLSAIDGMRTFSGVSSRRRIDWFHAWDLAVVQYFAFAGSCAYHVLPELRTVEERAAAAIWTEFRDGIRTILGEGSLADLFSMQWYIEEGWASSRYGLRHERPYDSIYRGLDALFAELDSVRGPSLTADATYLVGSLRLQMEAVRWKAGFVSMPEAVRQVAVQNRQLRGRLSLYGLV
jgi:HEAT repeat protein